ncbi:hypothetical protein [Leptolyngbya sp. FACHB-16]|uniref:hypothetical protein n=1 Tax=unclassified Leptolyngbya TaxID=2650499 RepID=UPI001686A2DE|nr:hypothetical protein [Leptolyngbya sp. FACHB-16]MBD2154638.1 hypothetical protein [Leptolyngbya sp. FACHB-16]
MNITLEQSIQNADGRYLTDSELDTLHVYIKTYEARLKTYTLLQEKSGEYILLALQKLAKTDAQTVQQHKDKCIRDMDYVVRSIAIAILRDDEEGFRQELLLWMQNIMVALHKEQQSSRAYRMLQEVVTQEMPKECSDLVNHYLDEFTKALLAGVA